MVEKVKCPNYILQLELDGNADSDTALSESEAVWMLSDSEIEELDMEEEAETLKGGELDIEEVVAMEDSAPDHGLLIPGFNKVVRRSTRLEGRKKNGQENGLEVKKLSQVQIAIPRGRR